MQNLIQINDESTDSDDSYSFPSPKDTPSAPAKSSGRLAEPLSDRNSFSTVGKFSGYQGDENFSTNTKNDISKTFAIKSKCVFEAAFQDIIQKLKGEGELSIDVAISIISMYEKASATVRNHFPGAEPSRKILTIVQSELEKYNILPKNTLFAQSICPNEINYSSGGISHVFTEYFGDCFHLGGLAGIPFTGSTGFAAFSHHVPDDGNLFILFAPHIGLSETYKLGKYSRRGQSSEGDSCGSVCNAFSHCIECKPIPTHESLGANPFDYQMNFIIYEVSKRLEVILAKETDNGKQAELANQMFEIMKEFLNKIVSLNFGSKFSNLILLGGVQINMPGPQTDFFQPLFFEIRHKDRSTNSTIPATGPDAHGDGHDDDDGHGANTTLRPDIVIDLLPTFTQSKMHEVDSSSGIAGMSI